MGVQHDISIVTLSGQVACNPDAEHVRDEDTVRWSSTDYSDWRVIFGPNAPVSPRVLRPAQPTAVVTAHRVDDFHRHKYTVIAWNGSAVSETDPQLIVDE